MKLVTGHKGFIGSNLLMQLLKLNVPCMGMEKEEMARLVENHNFHSFLISQKITGIYHIGAIADTSYTAPDIYYYNTHLPRALFIAAAKLGIRVVYSSSAAIYGVENQRYPVNHYAWSKYFAEKMGVDIFGNIDFVALRYFNVYGNGESHKGKMASVRHQAWVTNKIGVPFSLFDGSDRFKRDFVYIDDIINANIHAMENSFCGGVYEVGTGESRSFTDVLNLMNLSYIIDINKKVPNGYQEYTKANADMFLPKWIPMITLEMGANKYRDYLERL